MATTASAVSKPSLFASLFSRRQVERRRGRGQQRSRRPWKGRCTCRSGRRSACQVRRTGAGAARKTRRLDLQARLGRHPDRRAGENPNRRRSPAASAEKAEPKAADAGRHHQCPRLLGRHAAPKQATPAQVAALKAREAFACRRSATDRQRLRRLPGAGLRAGLRLAGRPLEHRRRQRADPAQRPSGAQRRATRWPSPTSPRWSPRDRAGSADA